MNATSGGLIGILARVPVLGYVLKVVHDIVMLPVIRLDLHRDYLAVAERARRLEAESISTQQRFDTLLHNVSEDLAEWAKARAAMETQEEAFAVVLRRHGRALAALRDGTQPVRSIHAPEPQMADKAPVDTPAILLNVHPEIRLNLGASHRLQFGLRVGAGISDDVDVVADPSELPFLPGTVAEIFAGRLLGTCVTREGRRLLSHWSSLLQPGGTLHVKVGEFESAAHLNGAGREGLHRILQEFGFHPVIERPSEDSSSVGLEIEIRATKVVRQFVPTRSRTVASA